MDIIVIIGVLGSLASIYGAFLAIKAKNAALSSAAIAESAKNEVLKKQKTTSLTGIMYEAKRTQQTFGKYSIAQSNKSLVGVQFEKDSENLQNFIFQFNVSAPPSTCFPLISWPIALHKNNSYGQKRRDGPPDGGIRGQRAEPEGIQRLQGDVPAHLQLLVQETQERK